MKNVRRTDITKGEFSPSSIDDCACLRQFYLRKILKVTPIFDNESATFGSCMHAGVAEFYTSRDKNKTIQAFIEAYAESMRRSSQKYPAVLGIAKMSQYCDFYKNDIQTFNPAFIEVTQVCAMPNGTTLLCVVDRIWKDDSTSLVIDTKTTMKLPMDFYFKQYETCGQFTSYYYMLNSILGGCFNILTDTICLDPKKTPQDAFIRRSFFRTDRQIAEFINSYIRVTNYIMDGFQLPEERRLDHFYQNTTQCANYGGCKYCAICKHGFQSSIMIDFAIEVTTDE
jgi:hypothetical protein